MCSSSLDNAVKTALEKKYPNLRDSGFAYEIELPIDESFVLDKGMADAICHSSDPMQTLRTILSVHYHSERSEIKEQIRHMIAPYIDEMHHNPNETFSFDDYFDHLVEWIYPVNHYLKQCFRVDIVVDTGDADYDFALNNPFPMIASSYHLSPEDVEDIRAEQDINEESSLLWLARQQGYTKNQLRDALLHSSMESPDGFLKSCWLEAEEMCDDEIGALTFLVQMSLLDIIKIYGGIRLRDKNGEEARATKRPYCGYIFLDKRTKVGLYNPYHGSASVMGIQLDKDVVLPIRFVDSALPDGCLGYGMAAICSFELDENDWQDTVKRILTVEEIDEMRVKVARSGQPVASWEFFHSCLDCYRHSNRVPKR